MRSTIAGSTFLRNISTFAQYPSGSFTTLMTWSAPGTTMHIFSQAAASNSLCIMLQGMNLSASPWMNSVGVTERFTASMGAASLRS